MAKPKLKRVSNTVGNPTTGLGQGYAEAEKKGVGIKPGAHPEYQNPKPVAGSGFVKKVGDELKKMLPKPKPQAPPKKK